MSVRQWKRSEVIILTGFTYSQIDYLMNQGLINPEKVGGLWRFTWEELIILRSIARLRDGCSLQKLREAIDFIAPHTGLSDHHHRLIASQNEVYWIPDTDRDIAQTLIHITGKNQGQILASFTVADLVGDLWQVGESKIIDFPNRAEMLPVA